MINENIVPHLNSLYRFQFEKAQNAYVLLYPEGMVKLNGSAGEILALVNGENSFSRIVTLLSEKFPDADTLDQDVNEFLEDARSRNWITLED